MVKLIINAPLHPDNVFVDNWMIRYDKEDWTQDFPNTEKGMLDSAIEVIKNEWAWRVQMMKEDGTHFMEVEIF